MAKFVGGGGRGRTGERVKRDTLRHQTVEFLRVLINTCHAMMDVKTVK